MRKRWLRELTDFAIITTVVALVACFVLTLVGYVFYHSPDLLFTYGVPLCVGVGVLDAIAVALNIKYPRPAMRAISLDQSRKRLELSTAEWFIRDNDALYRHYTISEVIAHVKQFKGIVLTNDEAIALVQMARDEAGYIDPDEELPEQNLDAVGWPVMHLDRSGMDDFDLLVEQQDQEIVHDSDGA